MAERRSSDEGPVDYIDCEIPQGMTIKQWRGEESRPPRSGGRLRAVAAAMGRAARFHRRGN